MLKVLATLDRVVLASDALGRAWTDYKRLAQRVRADPAANHRPHYPGRPGYGPGTKNPNGQECVPGPTGCQYRTAVDGLAAGQ